ncbi:PREDICTED: L-type lectin-domain containing receptor kinase IV.1-like [Nelumbo nucifera]|uniref:non-specific serine/threonine protein kinase n=2 Tax=Nelumbo nucifera TaxID=4432 RepID=A0A1U7ZX38_NELNU|nr:PREDICTED: L-type lectin-domain containing receptor kinase IV.1-like [Nelumbo nucifera]DAD26492.1 TPA_asm: hypothetical protein HUJ06_027960 [Nelumbo nucifera]
MQDAALLNSSLCGRNTKSCAPFIRKLSLVRKNQNLCAYSVCLIATIMLHVKRGRPLFLVLLLSFAASEGSSFTYNGFQGVNLNLSGSAQITSGGVLRLTSSTKQNLGHAFYPFSLHFKNPGPKHGNVVSFSTAFVFAIVPPYPDISGHGMAFVIAPSRNLSVAQSGGQFLGLFNNSNNGNSSNHVVAIELDTVKSNDFSDINDNHVGIDINSLNSSLSAPAYFHTDHNGGRQNLSLTSGNPMQLWIEYCGEKKQIDVTLAPFNVDKPDIPLLSLNYDLSPIMKDPMYVGFSASTGSSFASHYVLGWSFNLNGPAKNLTLSRLPKLPRPKERSKFLTIGLPIVIVVFVSTVALGVHFFVTRRRKFAELVEDWEIDYGPHRFKYKDLYLATKGFGDKELLGCGGFGSVYKGILTTSRIEIAVKRISHDSRQGMREFVAEVVSIGRMRHRNLVQLLGYCRRKGELLLVYDYMPNRSLDKFIFNQPTCLLSWSQRFRIIKGVASGLLYLHEEWVQVVVHRDVKSSNVLLDGEMNGRLGDFGLAKLYDHGSDPQTTHVVGTVGYMAPELTRTSKATPSTDVFAFGAFMLEVACGRRPIEPRAQAAEDLLLVDWVFSCWSKGTILDSVDPNLGAEYVVEEMELVLKLGLMCSHYSPAVRPSMRQVVQFLGGDAPLPDPSSSSSFGRLTFRHVGEAYDDFVMSYPFSLDKTFAETQTSAADSVVSAGG